MTEELCQRAWIDLARRMRTYRYDPGKTFRFWLRRLCDSRAIDLLPKKKADAVESLEDHPAESFLQDASDGFDALLWYEEIPTKRRSIKCCPQRSCWNQKTPGKSRITPRSKSR